MNVLHIDRNGITIMGRGRARAYCEIDPDIHDNVRFATDPDATNPAVATCPQCIVARARERAAGIVDRPITSYANKEAYLSAILDNSVLQSWVMMLPRREQGTMLTGIRGCDLAPKPASVGDGDASTERGLTAFLRYCVMKPADPREVDIPGAFFQSRPPVKWKASQLGHYPQHWYSHLMHCFEVVAYRHPSEALAAEALAVYFRLVKNMHLEPESKAQMIERLSEDRIATQTVVS